MKKFLLAAVLVVLASGTSYGQIRGVQAGSADALQRLAEHRALMNAQRQVSGQLSVSGLKVGAKGVPTFIDAKVMQVIDEKNMLVGIEDSRVGKGRYSTWVMLKCPTQGITDGQFWRGGGWKDVAGSSALSVTGTTTYVTAIGATKTVLVLEPMSKEEADKLAAEEALYRNWRIGKNVLSGKFIEHKGGDVYIQERGKDKPQKVRFSELSIPDRKWVRSESKRRRIISLKKNTDKKSESGQSNSETPDTVLLNWHNDTYKVTVRQTGKDSWEEVQDATGKVVWKYSEKSRNKEFVELYCPKRKYEVRLLNKRMELKKDGKWIWVADGHWESKE
ncbi:hypothetical protein [Gimesia fumaroli]|uniref:Uncharacterized protein n=1 Tax=Gimesia fumaroli TaxID=2527976 RepID=A0A518I8M5_9PLAN|nr:hypothetical protein [Gimesia fumaroli]QDV49440.1 hypothetical protein Enr17x_14580 [Gimesia fumaroli]